MNNKGFAVSTILYTILIAFMLFLGVAMAMFSASNNLSVSANDDLINGSDFKISEITASGDGVDGDRYKLKISSKYGIAYYPRDWKNGNEPIMDQSTDKYNFAGLNQKKLYIYKNIGLYEEAPYLYFYDTITGEWFKLKNDGSDNYECESHSDGDCN